MRNITGLKKELILMANIKNRELRKLPLRVSWYLQRTFKNEKLTLLDGKYIVNTFIPPFPSRAFDRLIKNTADVYRRILSPYSAYIALTDRCGFKCWHCSKSYRQGKEVNRDKWVEIINKLQEIGISVIGFTGGEPLYREDLEEIIKSVDDRSTTILFTSGDGLTDERARSLKQAGLYYITVSLDDYDRIRHNQLRGSDKAFEIAVEAVKNSLNNGFYTAVQLTVRKNFLNQKDMDRYIEFVKNLGAQEIRIIEPMPTGRLIKEGKGIFLDNLEREFLKGYHRRINKNKTMPKIASFMYIEDKNLYGCGAGIQHIYIDAFGNLSPCDFTPLSFGNLQEEDFDIPYRKLREEFSRPRDKCFVLDNMGQIRSAFKDNLPLPYEESKKVCKVCSKGVLPEFYRRLGWE